MKRFSLPLALKRFRHDFISFRQCLTCCWTPKIHPTKLIAVTMFCFLVKGSVLAQGRVATVNTEKVFSHYWKTKRLDALLQKKAEGFNQSDEQMNEQLQRDDYDYQQLLNEENNPSLSPDKCQARRRAVEGKLEAMRELQYNITEYDRHARATLAIKEARLSKAILHDIVPAITNLARANGYSLVVDSSLGSYMAGEREPVYVPVVVYSNFTNDITQRVLSQLNARAPVNPAKHKIRLSRLNNDG